METKEKNKSLSARIKRRNACRFKGEGTQGKWVKTSPYGDWQDQPTRLADKQREIGKNGNRNLHKHQRKLEYLQMLNKFKPAN